MEGYIYASFLFFMHTHNQHFSLYCHVYQRDYLFSLRVVYKNKIMIAISII